MQIFADAFHNHHDPKPVPCRTLLRLPQRRLLPRRSENLRPALRIPSVQYHLFYALRRIRRCHVKLQRTPLRQKHRIALPSHQLHIVRRNAVIAILEYNFPVASADHDANLCSAPSCLHQDHRSQFPCVCICKCVNCRISSCISSTFISSSIVIVILLPRPFCHFIFLAFRPHFLTFSLSFSQIQVKPATPALANTISPKSKIPRRRSSSHSMEFHFYFSTIIHFRGQFSAQRPQPVHFAGSISARWSTT